MEANKKNLKIIERKIRIFESKSEREIRKGKRCLEKYRKKMAKNK